MVVVWTVLRWLAFVVALCGWFALVSHSTKLNSAFLPVVTLSALTVVLFTAGVFHFLHVAAWGLFFAGIGLLILFIVGCCRKKASLSFLYSPPMLFFFVASAVFIPILWGAHYYHYDNFSHWGTVLSEMLSFRDFPTAHTVVVFRDYAPGTASFLYWFCTVVGKGEDIALMGQALFSCGALTALFFRVKKVRSFSFWAYTVLALTLTCLLVYDDGTLQIYNLLVDALMGFLAVAAWFLREEYRHRPLRGWFFMTPVLTFLILVKSNAALLLIFFGLFLFYDSRKSPLGKVKKWFFLIPFVGVFLYRQLWSFYREVTYGAPTNSYEYSGLIETFRERTPSFYRNLLQTFWEKISDLSRTYVIIFLLLNFLAVCGLILLRYKNKDRTYLRRTLIAVNGLMVGYSVALLFMYGFIMAVGEAIHLAAFERYVMTPLIVFTALLTEAIISTFSKVLQKKPLSVRLLPLCLSLLLFSMISGQAMQLVIRPDFASTERGKVMDVLQDAAQIIPRNSKVAMCNGERGRRDLYYYLMMYELKTRACFDLDFGQPEYSIRVDVEMLKEYDYLIIAANHYLIAQELVRAGFVVNWNKDCSVYRIHENSAGKIAVSPA